MSRLPSICTRSASCCTTRSSARHRFAATSPRSCRVTSIRRPLLSKRRRDIPIPRELDELCAALLAKDPAQRPTASEAVQRLEELLAKLPKRAGSGSATPSPLTSDALTPAAPDRGWGAHADHQSCGPSLVSRGPPPWRCVRPEGPATMLLPAQAVRVSDLVKIADPAKRAEIDALEGESSRAPANAKCAA